MRTSSVLAAFAAVAAACAPQPSATSNSSSQAITVTKPETNTALPAPTVPGAVVRIRAEDTGKSIAIPVGQTFQIELRGVPTAGYLWGPKSIPDFLEKTAEMGGDTTTQQSKPGFVGGNHWEVFAFKANRVGSGVVLLEQRRPWETNEPPAATFSVTITAR